MSVVYVVQEVLQKNRDGEWERKYDLSAAESYGTLRIAQGADSQVPDVPTLLTSLRDFRADDYLLPIGSPLVIGAATAIAAARSGGVVKMLRWCRRRRRYLPVSVDLSSVR